MRCRDDHSSMREFLGMTANAVRHLPMPLLPLRSRFLVWTPAIPGSLTLRTT